VTLCGMNLSRLAFATMSAVLLLASPAAASTAAAGPSPTPLILELILAAVVVAGMAARRPASRAVAAIRRGLTPRRHAATRARNV
jgi:hypothetical protein